MSVSQSTTSWWMGRSAIPCSLYTWTPFK